VKNLILLFSILIGILSCRGQESIPDEYKLTISPTIDKIDQTNQAIIQALSEFLRTKNASLTESKYWLASDFEKYIYPYLDIYNIENSKYGKDFYKPTLMEIIATDDPSKRILKIAFIGHNNETNENQVKSIYNMVANINQDKVYFSRYLDYTTSNWNTIKRESLTYKISPQRVANAEEINRQIEDIKMVSNFFKCEPIPITYFSCIDPKEVFQIKGFDYHPMMYVDKTGGLADYGNIVFSGNNSDIYTHEIVHIYTSKLFPKINKFLDEGLATFLAGSGKYNYEWHRNKLDKFLVSNKDYNFADHKDAYERIYFEQETSIPYLTAALIIERIIQLYGKEKLMSLLNSEDDLWTILKTIGLSRENINDELRKQIKVVPSMLKH
jgi:hypothetical protein